MKTERVLAELGRKGNLRAPTDGGRNCDGELTTGEEHHSPISGHEGRCRENVMRNMQSVSPQDYLPSLVDQTTIASLVGSISLHHQTSRGLS